MRFLRLLSVSAVMLIFSMTVAVQIQRGQGVNVPAPGQQALSPKQLLMIVDGFADGSDIPVKYSEAGSETSPGITWSDVPSGTVSFVLHFHDMEGHIKGTTEEPLHWLVWNIPDTATGLPEGIAKGSPLPNGVSQISNKGPWYHGPGAAADMPRHHYTFELFALDVMLNVKPGSDAFETRANIMKAMQGHVIGKAVFIGRFHRPQ
jgi:Raf kinase inhibitor-like YbhB/YbcL family protein